MIRFLAILVLVCFAACACGGDDSSGGSNGGASGTGGAQGGSSSATGGTGGIGDCTATVERVVNNVRCDARPLTSIPISEGTDCVFVIDPSINPYDIQDVAFNCPPMLDDEGPDDEVAYIINFQEDTITVYGCSMHPPTDRVVFYETTNCMPVPM